MAASKFDLWLIDKLRSLKTDESVFGSYISGILEGEDTVDEKRDALEDILSEIVVSKNPMENTRSSLESLLKFVTVKFLRKKTSRYTYKKYLRSGRNVNRKKRLHNLQQMSIANLPNFSNPRHWPLQLDENTQTKKRKYEKRSCLSTVNSLTMR